jgi:hypothetical protein
MVALAHPPPTAPRAGTNAAVTRGPGGFSVSLGKPKQWQHPWQTQLWWLGDLKQWVATVLPGFVNGEAPVVNTTAALALSLAKAGTFYNGLITARSGAADIARAASLAAESTAAADATPAGQVDVKLTNNPPIQLAFRNVGFDSDGTVGSAVPQFFKNLGVQNSPQPANLSDPNNPDTADAVVAALNVQPTPGNRLLRASDIVVHQPRMALTSTISIEDGAITGISNVTQTLGIRSAAPGDRLKVFATSLFDPGSAAALGIDPLSGDYEEPTWDELLVSTVYLLSPPNAVPLSQPDSSWVPYVAHTLFWNLTYLARTVLQVPQLGNATGELVTLGSTLAGGLASFAVNTISASINDAMQNALNLLTAQSLAGTWWTATGGGSSSTFPASPAPAPAPAGWNQAEALQAKRIAAARALKAATLDPQFPYSGVPFTPSLLNP